MKKTVCILAVMAVGLLGLTTTTLAADYGYGGGAPSRHFDNRVDRRQDKQWARINNGIKSGSLSRREAKRLRKDQRKINRMERGFERDGYYGPRERRAMKHALDRTNHRIKRSKHNDYGRSYGRHHRTGRHGHPHGTGSNTYEEFDDTYVAGSSSSTTISAQTEGFSVSWSAAEQQ